MTLEAVALTSLGRHPASLRPRLPDLDARALALARGAGAVVTALHVGPPATGEAVLRSCLGLGAARAVLIPAAPSCDPLPALLNWLQAHRCPLIVAGECAEAGECSGMVPYLVAETLGCALVSRAVGLDGRTVIQALPGGLRRALHAGPPLVLVAGHSAPSAPLGAFGPARRGRIDVAPAPAPADDAIAAWPRQPARKRPRRLLSGTAVSTGETARRQELVGADPAAAADAILDFLARESLLSLSPAPQEGS